MIMDHPIQWQKIENEEGKTFSLIWINFWKEHMFFNDIQKKPYIREKHVVLIN